MANNAPKYTNVNTTGYEQSGPQGDMRVDMGYDIPSSMPPEDYTPRRYDVNKFEKTVFKQLGGNPFDIDVNAEIEKANKDIPGLFRHVFRGKLTWNQRNKMDKKQAIFWKQVLTMYRRDVQNSAIRDRNAKVYKYKNMMSTFDAEKKEFEARMKTYETRRSALQKEYRGMKVWVHNRQDNIKRQVHPIVAESILKSDSNWKLGQPMTKEKQGKEEKVWIFNPSEHIKRQIPLEEAEDLLRITDWDTNEPLWRLGQPYGREERPEKGAKDPTPQQALKRITAIKKELKNLEKADKDNAFINRANMKNKDQVGADIDASMEAYKAQLQEELDYYGQYTPKEPVEEVFPAEEALKRQLQKIGEETEEDIFKTFGGYIYEINSFIVGSLGAEPGQSVLDFALEKNLPYKIGKSIYELNEYIVGEIPEIVKKHPIYKIIYGIIERFGDSLLTDEDPTKEDMEALGTEILKNSDILSEISKLEDISTTKEEIPVGTTAIDKDTGERVRMEEDGQWHLITE